MAFKNSQDKNNNWQQKSIANKTKVASKKTRLKVMIYQQLCYNTEEIIQKAFKHIKKLCGSHVASTLAKFKTIPPYFEIIL